MSKNDTYLGRNQAIRACLAEQPESTPQEVVQVLAAQGVQISPAQVIVVQAVLRSERADRVAAAS